MKAQYTASATDAGRRLDIYLSERYPDVSRTATQKIIKAGDVLVNGRKTTPHYALRDGDVIDVSALPQPPALPTMAPEPDIALTVVYEDDDLAVIDKPSGLLVHPTVRGETGTLAHAILGRWPQAAAASESRERPGIVHRLDREASGLMIVAKTKPAFDALKKQFQKRTVKKEYLVLVHGRPPKDAGTINLAIGRSGQGDRMAARHQTLPGDRTAVTHYRIEETLPAATLVSAIIETGRTHQIRAHFKALGNPVVGDPLYRNRRFPALPVGRLFLHAAKLSFLQPTTRERLSFESALPSELKDALARLREKKSTT